MLARARIGKRVRTWGRGLSPAIALLGAMAFITQVGVSIMLPLLPLYATSLGATPTVLGLLTSGFAVTIAVGQLGGGYLVERLAPREHAPGGRLAVPAAAAGRGSTEAARPGRPSRRSGRGRPCHGRRRDRHRVERHPPPRPALPRPGLLPGLLRGVHHDLCGLHPGAARLGDGRGRPRLLGVRPGLDPAGPGPGKPGRSPRAPRRRDPRGGADPHLPDGVPRRAATAGPVPGVDRQRRRPDCARGVVLRAPRRRDRRRPAP